MNAQGKKVKFLRLDNAGEHQAELVKACTEEVELNIHLEFTAPNTPKQNGIVERKIVTDRERGHAMLESARFTERAKKLLRAEAEATATKLSNMLVSTTDGKMPNDLFGDETTLKIVDLIQFGRLCYVTKRQKIRRKWTDKSWKGIFVGYANDDHSSDTYRIYNLATNKIILTRDVRWADWQRVDPEKSVREWIDEPQPVVDAKQGNTKKIPKDLPDHLVPAFDDE